MKRFAWIVGLSLLAWGAKAQPYVPPVNTPTTNSSVTITTGSTFQTILTAVPTPGPTGAGQRHSLTIQNNNVTADNCWIFIGATGSATKPTSILLPQGASYTRYFPFIPSDNIAGTCATTGDSIYVDTQ
jgi:hypothetical protein